MRRTLLFAIVVGLSGSVASVDPIQYTINFAPTLGPVSLPANPSGTSTIKVFSSSNLAATALAVKLQGSTLSTTLTVT